MHVYGMRFGPPHRQYPSCFPLLSINSKIEISRPSEEKRRRGGRGKELQKYKYTHIQAQTGPCP